MPRTKPPARPATRAPSPTRGRTLAHHGDPSSVVVHTDPARKRRFDALLAQMHRSRRTESTGFDAYWETVAEVIDDELFVYGGYDTANAFLAAEVKVPRRTAVRMLRVARYATPAEEERYGTAMLDAAIAYIEARHGTAIKGRLPVRFEALRIPVVRDGATHRLALDAATFDEVNAAARALARANGARPAKRPPAEGALTTALARVASLAGVGVRVNDGMAHFGAVPLYALADFGRVLRATPLPDPVLAKPKPAPRTVRRR